MATTPIPMSARTARSTVRAAPQGFEVYAPYTVALIKLEEGPMVTAQLTDVAPADVEIGMPVEMVTRRIRAQGEDGTITYGYKFRPTFLALGAE